MAKHSPGKSRNEPKGGRHQQTPSRALLRHGASLRSYQRLARSHRHMWRKLRNIKGDINQSELRTDVIFGSVVIDSYQVS